MILFALWVLGSREAGTLIKALVEDVVGLVEANLQQINTSRVRSKLGWQQQPWDLPLKSRV
jgi:hypothetical protein